MPRRRISSAVSGPAASSVAVIGDLRSGQVPASEPPGRCRQCRVHLDGQRSPYHPERMVLWKRYLTYGILASRVNGRDMTAEGQAWGRKGGPAESGTELGG